ncbi:MAG TPA: LD-carboxypeptidase [Chitinophagaceae bacterium]|nr:LD-carboxypeptidase [Chitinophagaceae bacterium]
MITTPPSLKPGNTIGLVCPAGFMASEKVETCIRTLRQWGFNVKTGSTVGSHSDNYFSGTDEERLNDLQQMLDDDSVHAILCARGGYGVSRIIDRINFKKFKKHPKWIVGYSDITVLLSHIYSNYKIAGLHSPMAGAFNDGGADTEYVQSLRRALTGDRMSYQCDPHPFNKKGKAEGALVGGNLSLLVSLTGTASDLKTKGKILFVEDIGEYLYSIDRMFWHLKRTGKLEKLAGLIIGGFTDTKDTERPFGKPVYNIIHDIVKEYDYPICFGFPVSHSDENYALKTGVVHQLVVRNDSVQLRESLK